MEVLRSSFGNQVADRVELTAKNQGDEQSLCDKIIEVVKTILTTMVYYLTCTAVDLSEPKKTEEEEGGGHPQNRKRRRKRLQREPKRRLGIRLIREILHLRIKTTFLQSSLKPSPKKGSLLKSKRN